MAVCCMSFKPSMSLKSDESFLDIRVSKFMIYGDVYKKPRLSFTPGRAILKPLTCAISSKALEKPVLSVLDEARDFLDVELWDCHEFSSDILVGSAKVPLHNVTSENFHHFTTQLFSKNERLVGEVQLKIRRGKPNMLASVGLPERSMLRDGLPDLRGTEIPSTRIRAHIGDLYEFKLEGYNTSLKEIDPYISMKYGDAVYKTEKSTEGVVLKDFRFVCKADEAIKELDVNLWKGHRIIPDELVGSAKIKLDSVTSGAFHYIMTRLYSKDGRDVGEVGLKVRRVKPNDVNHPLKTNKRGNFHKCTKQ